MILICRKRRIAERRENEEREIGGERKRKWV
jgi:hypothetical protein